MFYKLYIGDYNPKGGMCAAPTMIEPMVNFNGLSGQVKRSLEKVHHGLDLYIVKPNGEVFAWYRDLSKYSKEDIRRILQFE
jgi:hypothetical protein